MAAGNDNAGLKAATAIFGALTLLLAVACYFLYSSYADTSQRLAAANSEKSKADQEKNQAVDHFRKTRELAGFLGEKFLTSEDVTKEYATKKAEIQKQVEAIGTQIETALSAAEADAKASNLANLPDEIKKLRDDGVAIRQQYANDKDMASQLDRLAKMAVNASSLLAQLSRDNISLRRSLVAMNGVNNAQVQVATKDRDAKAADAVKAQQESDEAQRTIRADLSRLQEENTKLVQSVEALRTEMAEKQKKSDDTIADLQNINAKQREDLAKRDIVLDTPDGYITSVDLRRKEVKADITRSMGARPQMVMTIFDKNSPGLPTDRPKGSIQLTSVNNDYSMATILSMTDIAHPIVAGDIIYSAAWSPNEPERFALIGRMDMNRDGADDRDDVRRMIERAGGIVDYDLPPANIGQEKGKLTARIRWYVIDDREVVRNAKAEAGILTEAQKKFLARQKEMVDEARKNGLQPMPLQRLATYLNVANTDRGVPQLGSTTYKSDRVINSVLYPKGKPPAPEAPAAEPDAAKAEPETKKDEQP